MFNIIYKMFNSLFYCNTKEVNELGFCDDDCFALTSDLAKIGEDLKETSPYPLTEDDKNGKF